MIKIKNMGYTEEQVRQLQQNVLNNSKKKVNTGSVTKDMPKTANTTKIDNKIKEVDIVNPEWKDNASFYIDYVLPSLNEYIDVERGNLFGANKIKRESTDAVAFRCIHLFNTINPKGKYNVSVHWTVPNNKKDSDNIFFGVKAILDGIVEAKVLKGDGRKYIQNITHTIETVKDKYLVLVTLNKV